jgi:16S rRNA C967 or C1407 C5-methylase (RsmB/RsmF family)
MDKFEAIYNLVKKWNDSRKSLQICTNDFFHQYKHFSVQEKSFIESLAAHQIKHFIYLKFFQEYIDKNKVYPSEFKGKIRELFVLLVHHESLNEAEELLQQHYPKFADSFRDFYLKTKFHFKKFEKDIVSRTNYKKQLYVLYSYSRELIDLWTDQYAENYIVSLMKGLNQKPIVSIRNNPQKFSRKELRKELEMYNIFSTPSEFSPKILHVKNKGIYELLHSEPFQKGYFMILDEGEAILNQIHKAKHGELILDLNPPTIDFILSYALDAPFRSRIIVPFMNKKDLYQGVKKIKSYKIPHLDLIHTSSQSDLLKKYQNAVDTVFIRPKTSQFGRLKVYPDRKWNLQKKYIFKLTDQQYQLLEEANELLKVGGHLIYISDTINLLENEKLINKFLLNYPNYRQIRDFQFEPEFLNKFIQSDNSVFFHPKDIPFSSFYAVKLEKAEK